MRPWDNVDDMNSNLIRNWNDTVSEGDRVYLLGDVAFKSSVMNEIIPQLKGRICLVPGNHEPTKMRTYFKLFDDVRGYVQRKGFIMSHIPLHPKSLGCWGLNIHGHLHNNTVKMTKFNGGNPIEIDDPRYFCACVERTNYRPIELTEILKRCKSDADIPF
jgi:calcineurin-like phosphoesterase family protein